LRWTGGLRGRRQRHTDQRERHARMVTPSHCDYAWQIPRSDARAYCRNIPAGGAGGPVYALTTLLATSQPEGDFPQSMQVHTSL
jgi:hypothetical protein